MSAREEAGRGTAPSSVVEVTHPLVRHKLGLLRDVRTTTEMFRRLVNELTLLLTSEATKDMSIEEVHDIDSDLGHEFEQWARREPGLQAVRDTLAGLARPVARRKAKKPRRR